MDSNNNQNNGSSSSGGSSKNLVNRAAKGAATYFGGPIGGAVVDAATKSRLGQRVFRNQKNVQGAPKEDVQTNSASYSPDNLTSGTNDSGSNKSSKRGSLFGGKKNDDDDNRDEGKARTIKDRWNGLSLKQKFIALGILSGVAVFFIIISAVLGIIPMNFLDYSKEVGSSKDVEAEYEEFWKDFCGEESDNCTEEQKARAKEFQESQLKFYERLNSLAKKNSLSSKQKYLVLTTIFLGYDIDAFTEGQSAFTLDETDEINEDPSANVNEDNIYVREKDSLKELVKQFKVSTASCVYDQKLDSGEVKAGVSYPLRDLENNLMVFNFVERVSIAFGGNPKEGFKEAKELCLARTNGKIEVGETKDEEAAIEGFYNYLKTTDYLDVRPQLASYYTEFAKNNGISLDYNNWADEEKIMVRELIIKDIRSIVDEYEKEVGPEFIASTGKAYWWPIGSLETKPGENGVEFASGDPQFTHITSNYGWRVHPISGEKHLHNGVDLQGTMGQTNIIASLNGEVIAINNTCVSRSVTSADMKCGGGYGNHVKIQDTKGNVTIYAHMYKDSITVSVGDAVSQGQVIGKVGSSGSSTGAHLHFTLIINGSTVNPLDYIDASKPRPSSNSSVDFNATSYTREEFISRLEAYYTNKNCNGKSGCESFKREITSSGGAGIIYDTAGKRNLNPELIVARSELEGYSPGTYYNYFGYGCTNTGGLAACYKFTSFEAGIDEFFKNISQYDSVESMMSRYSYLGSYWYTGKHWGIGGCAYASYIYPDGIPDRVSEACSYPDGYCSVANTLNCVETTQEDRDAYTNWQVYKMATVIQGIFG